MIHNHNEEKKEENNIGSGRESEERKIKAETREQPQNLLEVKTDNKTNLQDSLNKFSLEAVIQCTTSWQHI